VKNFKLLVSNKYLFRQALGEVIFFPHIIIIYFFIMQTFEVFYFLFFFLVHSTLISYIHLNF
jgi:hypothetical protein